MVDPDRLLNEPSYFVEEYLDVSNNEDDVPNKVFDYQKDFMDHPSDRKAFVSGRRVGKSKTAAWLALWKALTFADAEVLLTAKARRQSMELFRQIEKEIANAEMSESEWGIVRSTRTEINFDNGSRIIALPVGRDGSNIRGYGGPNNMIIVDEAAFIPDEVFQEVLSPMMAVGGGEFILLSTPFGKNGFLYERFEEANDSKYDSKWHTVQVPSWENPLVDDEFIAEQRKNLTRTQFKQEIEGQFVESANSFFTKEELENASQESVTRESNRAYLGVDLASSGADESVYVSIDGDGNVFDIEHTADKPMTEAMRRVRELHNRYDYDKILIDNTSLGQGTVDHLRETLGNRVEGFKFTNQKKQNLYNTLKTKLQNGEVRFEYIRGKDDKEGNRLFRQCEALEREYTKSGKVRIEHADGEHDDYSDAFALAVWAQKQSQSIAPDEGAKRPFNMGSLR